MFTIAPIGSCRIATPLRLNRDIYGYEIDFNRNYGFCHSSAEAVQQLKYIDGQLELEPEIWPLIARGKDQKQIEAQRKGDVDLFIVEMSSAKVLKIGDSCVQLNYLRNEYDAFFSDFDRARHFWAVNKTGDQAKIDIYLKERWSDGPNQLEDTGVLRRIRMSVVDEARLRQDVQWIMNSVPNVMFVTHVNAVRPDQKTIASRENFIKTVVHVVREEGGLVYDPTSSMQEFGQTTAIEDYSDSLAHFTPEFCYHFFMDWYNLAIEPAIDAKVKSIGEPAIKNILQPNVDALIKNGNAVHLADRLDKLKPMFASNQLFSVLRAQVDVANNKNTAAYDRLSKAFDANPDNLEILRSLSQVAFDTGEVELSLVCYRKLVSLNDLPSAEQLYSMGQILVSRGNDRLGLDFFELAYFLSPMSRDLAKAYVELAVVADPERLSYLKPDEYRRLLTRLDIEDWISLVIARQEATGDAFWVDLARGLANLDGPQMYGLIRHLGAQIDVLFRVKLIACWRKTQSQERLLDRGLRKLVDDVYENQYSPDLLIQDQLALIDAMIAADPAHRGARIAARNTRATLLAQARTLYKERERSKLDALADKFKGYVDLLPGLALLQARLALAENQPEDAMEHARRAALEAPKSGISWIILIRSTYRAGDFLALSEACHDFLSQCDDIEPAWEDEVRSRLKRLPANALKAARKEDDPLVAYRLFGLAQTDPNFSEVANLMRERIELKLSKQLRELAKTEVNLEEFLSSANPIVSVVENGIAAERTFVAIGRKLVKYRAFSLALPFWEKALEHAPVNENYAFQRDRCLERIGTTTIPLLDNTQQAKG